MYWRGVPYIKKKARHSRSAPSNIKKISTNEGSKVTFKKIFLVIKKKERKKETKDGTHEGLHTWKEQQQQFAYADVDEISSDEEGGSQISSSALRVDGSGQGGISHIWKDRFDSEAKDAQDSRTEGEGARCRNSSSAERDRNGFCSRTIPPRRSQDSRRYRRNGFRLSSSDDPEEGIRTHPVCDRGSSHGTLQSMVDTRSSPETQDDPSETHRLLQGTMRRRHDQERMGLRYDSYTQFDHTKKHTHSLFERKMRRMKREREPKIKSNQIKKNFF